MESNRKEYALRKWEIRKNMLGKLGREIDAELISLPGEEQDWMRYLMATLPVSDLANYPLSAWTPYIRHALKLRNEISWCKDLPETIFTDYVFYPRINTEDIEECRQLFYSELMPRIQGMNEEQAVIETNYWCQEHVTYQMADDRTKSAMTAYRSCGGRCGEESTFTVTALRAIGVPSRQVYAPWWSHCDDNHAWVEVYIDGKWHFLGACEAAPKLDTGWFTNASSRAMVVHARTFTGAENDEELKVLYGDQAYRFHVENGVTYEHVTDLYALLSNVEVTVLKEDGTPAEDALVRFEILNMAEMMSAANIRTNKDGQVTTDLGRGQTHLHVIYTENDAVYMAEQDIVVGEEALKVTLTLNKEEALDEEVGEWTGFDFYAPLDTPMNPGLMTDEEKEIRNQKRNEGTRMREERIASFYQEDKAKKYLPVIRERLHDARGNFDELMTFLERGNEVDKELRSAMLVSLTLKDMTDVKAEVLEEHLNCSGEYVGDYKPEIFADYVMCPRVFNETLTQYRAYILNYFDAAKQKAFRKDPESIMEWIEDHLITVPTMEYGDLFYTPAASLKSGLTTPQSRRILFVAICRTLGIAARLNPNSGEAEFSTKGKTFTSAEKQVKKNIRLTLKADDPKEWIDRQTFTLSRENGGFYQRIDMPQINEKNAFELMIEPGMYRVLTSNRLPNGHTYAYSYYFKAEEGRFGKGEVTLDLTKREAKLTEILSRNSIVDFPLKDKEGNRVMAGSLLEKKSNIFVWIEEGKEPTEHILNEMLAQKEDFQNLQGDIIFLLKNDEAKEQKTLAKALAAFPNVRIYYDDFNDNVQALGRRMYVDPDKLPLVILMHDGLCGVYASSGYNVGLGDLLLKIVKAFES